MPHVTTRMPPVRVGSATRDRCLRALTALTAFLSLTAPTHADTTQQSPPGDMPYVARTLLDRALNTHPVLLHRLDAAMLVYTDERGLMRREPLSEFLAILPPEAAHAPSPTSATRTSVAPPAWPHLLTLTDGQRFVGRLLDADDTDEPPVAFDSTIARFDVPLERVASLTRSGFEPMPRPGATSDALGLVNGDALDGFILALGTTTQIEVGTDVVVVPLDRVAWTLLANPAQTPPATMLWLDDATVVGVHLLAQERADAISARLTLTHVREPSLSEDHAPRLSILLAQVRAAALDAARLVPLADLPLRSVSSSLPWAPALVMSERALAPLGIPDLTLPAPMEVVWSLPPEAARLAFEALLPPDRHVWGHADLVVLLEQDGSIRELARATLEAARPVARVNVQLPAPADRRRERRLRIVLDQGPSGPAQDCAVLRRPLILLDQP